MANGIFRSPRLAGCLLILIFPGLISPSTLPALNLIQLSHADFLPCASFILSETEQSLFSRRNFTSQTGQPLSFVVKMLLR